MNSNCNTLANRVILITGAAGRLGSIAARACACEGATVILLDKTVSGLEAVYDSIVSLNRSKPAIYPFDLGGAMEQHYIELADTIKQKYGKLNGLLHNAAVLHALGPLEHLDAETWSNVLNVNLNAPYLLTRTLLPLLRSSMDASIVFTSDSSAVAAKAYWGAYSVSKIAIDGFARILADELENTADIRVNTLIPGPVNSPLRKKAFPAEKSSILIDPESLADLYVYLLGPESHGVTGQTIHSNNVANQGQSEQLHGYAE